MSSYEINKIKETVYTFIETGLLDSKLIEALTINGHPIRKESDYWDYKKDIPGDKKDQGKLLKQIVSFHNSHGGYLIFGIEEKNDSVRFSGIEENLIDEKSLRSQLRSFCGTEIDVTYNEFRENSSHLLIGALHIPKRGAKTKPVSFIKNGPQDKNNKNIFSIDDTYFRSGDDCRLAKSATDWEFLSSPRTTTWDEKRIYKIPSKPLSNNLPDSSLICSTFIGRDQILAALWQWLTDPFAYCKTLAGDGGKGKTSIAYEFCKEFCKVKPYSFEQLIWLTGKKEQFRPLKNSYENLPNTNFFCYSSLLNSICEELGMLEDDFKETSETYIKSQIRHHLHQLPSLIVLDDIDSLAPDDQRKSMELAMQVSQGTNSKFLLTTRMNLFFSTDMCITVAGLSENDFKDLTALMAKKFNVKLKNEQIKKLYRATLGSPLFLESIFRLVNTGSSLDVAINRWRAEDGEQAREAALLREIEQLSLEARRCLLALSYLTSASSIEIRQVTGYPSTLFDRTVEELKSLFLIENPSYIDSEPRFEVPSTTSSLVISNKEKLVTDHRAVETAVRKSRAHNESQGESKKKKNVGLAINQAFALIKEERSFEALETIKNALKSEKKHPDLILTLARIKLQHFPKLLNESRKDFKEAYNAGQRKQMLYDLWFDAEYQANHPQGMIEVSDLVIQSTRPPSSDWFYKKSLGEWLVAQNLIKSRNYLGAFSYVKNAQHSVNKAIRFSNPEKIPELIGVSKKLTDEAWSVAQSIDMKDGWIDALDITQAAIKYGDIRHSNFKHALFSLERLVELGFKESKNGKSFIALSIKNLEKNMEIKKKGEFSWSERELLAFEERIDALKKNL